MLLTPVFERFPCILWNRIGHEPLKICQQIMDKICCIRFVDFTTEWVTHARTLVGLLIIYIKWINTPCLIHVSFNPTKQQCVFFWCLQYVLLPFTFVKTWMQRSTSQCKFPSGDECRHNIVTIAVIYSNRKAKYCLQVGNKICKPD